MDRGIIYFILGIHLECPPDLYRRNCLQNCSKSVMYPRHVTERPVRVMVAVYKDENLLCVMQVHVLCLKHLLSVILIFRFCSGLVNLLQLIERVYT